MTVRCKSCNDPLQEKGYLKHLCIDCDSEDVYGSDDECDNN